MKRIVVGIALVLIAVGAANLLPSRAQEASTPGPQPPANPLKVALLKWFPAYRSTTFKVGKSPVGLAFDGANIWVSNQYGGSVTKLRASDGANLGTFPAASGAWGIAFDGTNIWVAGGPDIVELRQSDGKLLFYTRLPQGGGEGMAFHGANIWVADYSSDSVSKL